MASASWGISFGRMRTSRGTASGLTPVVEKKRSTRNVVGPTTSSVLTICSRNPATIDVIAMTVAMPLTTPGGAERLADPDLTRALCDAHEHDVHDDDAADDDPDHDHGGDDGENDPRELCPE